MFSDELKKYDWDETTARIASKTDNDVRFFFFNLPANVFKFNLLLAFSNSGRLFTFIKRYKSLVSVDMHIRIIDTVFRPIFTIDN